MHSALHILPHVALMMPLEPTLIYSGTTVQLDEFTSLSYLLYFVRVRVTVSVSVRVSVRVSLRVSIRVSIRVRVRFRARVRVINK